MRRGIARGHRDGRRPGRRRRDLRLRIRAISRWPADVCTQPRRRCGGRTARRTRACAWCAFRGRRRMVGGPQRLSHPTWRASIWRMSDPQEVSVELLRSLTPLEGMKRENLHALAKKVTVKEMTAGRTLFKEGAT